jgi:hypothetical protein
VSGPFDELEDLLGLVKTGRETFEHGKRAFERIAKKGAKSYEETHWGQPGGTIVLGEIPNAEGGTVALGRLVAIEYETTKGGPGAKPKIFRHVFGNAPEDGGDPTDTRTCPLLCYTLSERPSGLVIARANSRYTVTPHGIEG